MDISITIIQEKIKEFSLRHKLRFSNPFIFATKYHKYLLNQTTNYFKSNNQSLKYQYILSLFF